MCLTDLNANTGHSKVLMHIDFASDVATNTGAVTYLIDDVHFPQAVIIEAPVVALQKRLRRRLLLTLMMLRSLLMRPRLV